MGNPQRSSEQENVQRLFLLREVGFKRIRSGQPLIRYGKGEDIVCAYMKV